MKIIRSPYFSPYFNCTLEEVLLKNTSFKEDVLLIYQNENAIIIGRNQNVYEEIDLEKVKQEKIEIFRRLSGGGAVFHDLGNINFSFITNKKKITQEMFLKPMMDFLKSLGLKVNFHGRNDLILEEKKFSGNAQYVWKNRMFHHGTLLFDCNLEKLSQVLKPKKIKIESKSIKSVRQRVTNLKPYLKKMNHNQFIEKMIDFFIKNFDAKLISIAKGDQKKTLKLKKVKKSKEWIFGKNPEFSFSNEQKFANGIIKLIIKIEQNKIKNIKFEGDFLSRKNVEDVYESFLNQEYKKENIKKILSKINTKDYFGNIKKNEILKLFFG